MSDLDKFELSKVEVIEIKFVITCSLCHWQSRYLDEEWQAKNHFIYHLQWCPERRSYESKSTD